MKMVTLGEVCEIERKGISPSVLSPETLYLGLEHIERGGRILGHDTVANAELTSTKFTFTQEHVLFGKLRPNLGKISRPTFSGVCSTDILPIRPGKEVDRNYLAHFLSQPSMVEYSASRTTGANLPRLNPSVLASFEIPLPPLDEQRRIAAILDHADTLRAKRRRVFSHLDHLAQSIFVDMFGDLPTTPLGPQLTVITSGGRGWARYYAPEGAPFIRSLDVQMGHVTLENLARVAAPDNAEATRTRTCSGDVLLTITGSRIGRAAPLPSSLAGSYVSQHVAILRLETTLILPAFLSAFLCAPTLGQRQILSSQYGQTKPGLNFEQIRQFQIPCVQLSEQRELLRRLEGIDHLRYQAKNALLTANALFASLQSGAFRGEH